jgi:2-dehydro-3-deoxyglucarate aldolase/4-hydroxy-2-oxoheptanedioate aldolase
MMRLAQRSLYMKTLKEKMRACDLVCGMHITLADPSVTELCGRIGYDYLWIDTEHSPMDYQTVLHHLIAASSAGCDAIVRIPWNDAVMAKRVLEMGRRVFFSPWCVLLPNSTAPCRALCIRP